jgi:uncharacterized membrane protein
MRRAKLFIHLKSSLWFVPVLCVLAGAALSLGTIAIDRYFDYEALPSRVVGGPDAAAYILSTVAASMVSLTALVLTITMVVVQLAMGQFSPRIVQRILRDKPSQLAIGLFVATFVHAILALREVTINGDGTGHVPGIAVVTAFTLVLVSIAVLVVSCTTSDRHSASRRSSNSSATKRARFSTGDIRTRGRLSTLCWTLFP